MRVTTLVLVPLLLNIVLLVSCGQRQDKDATAHAVPGVNASEIRIGASLPLTGHASYLGIETLRGALSYIRHVNENGGVHGRAITLIAKDDGYDPPRCLWNTQQLIVQDDVFALSCYVGTPTTIKILPLVGEAKIPLVGMFTGANALRQPMSRYVLNIRPSYYQETKAAVRHLVEDLGVRRVAVLYQYDAYGFDGLTGIELALKEYNLAPVAKGTYVRGTLDIEDGLERIKDSGAEAVVLIGTYEPSAKFIKMARASDFSPYFYTVSFVGVEALARLLGPENQEGIFMSQVVPPPDDPESQSLLWDTEDYIGLLARYYPDDSPSFAGLEGYLNAKILVEGLRRAGPNLDRDRFIRAIEEMSAVPMGQGTLLSFSPTNHQGLDQVYFTRLSGDRFELIKDWNSLRQEHERAIDARSMQRTVPGNAPEGTP